MLEEQLRSTKEAQVEAETRLRTLQAQMEAQMRRVTFEGVCGCVCVCVGVWVCVCVYVCVCVCCITALFRSQTHARTISDKQEIDRLSKEIDALNGKNRDWQAVSFIEGGLNHFFFFWYAKFLPFLHI